TPSTHRTRTVGNSSGDREMAAVVLTFVLFVVGICIAISKMGKLSCDGRNTEEVVTTPQPRGRPFDMQQCNVPTLQERRLIRDTQLRNSTVSIQLQPSQNNNSNTDRTTTTVQQQTSNLPPTYDSIVEESGVIIIMQQQSLLPPTYEAFIQQKNERQETDS
ncbi:unnamed protein product, partial [Adineta steineri]